MKTLVCFAVAVSLIAGAIIGFKIGSRQHPPIVAAAASTTSISLQDELALERMNSAALDVMAFVNLLKGFRSGEQALAMDRLEAHLDLAVMELARSYSPQSDPYRVAAKNLKETRAYRVKYPYPNSLTNVVQMIDLALAAK